MTTAARRPTTLTRPASDRPAGRAATAAPRPREPIPSEALFAGAREVQIEHRGSLYRLKQTALGKLILTK